MLKKMGKNKGYALRSKNSISVFQDYFTQYCPFKMANLIPLLIQRAKRVK
jgi:uncharacterized protein YutD